MTNSELFETVVLVNLVVIGFLLVMLWRALYELRKEAQAHERDKALLDKTLAERANPVRGYDRYSRWSDDYYRRHGEQPLPYKLEPDTPYQQGTSDKGGSAQRRAVSYP